ncbi:hypothetical protein C6P45_004759 [Maudiozyma exigua]|uniref:Uncharacterized protein n=1 Tax=Maudiozyma exigua TaxID=34358 RepID=A0A9P6WED4_MAUEX|nr:hypothetical protein C6P45_004759 [Kazachstania exigua]
MSNSNNNNSANNQITQGLDIESEADVSMNIPTQHALTGVLEELMELKDLLTGSSGNLGQRARG